MNNLLGVAPDELAAMQNGVQLAQHLFGLQGREAIQNVALTNVNVAQGTIESMHFRLSTASEGWSFELRKIGDWWLPCAFRMESIK